MLEAIAMCEEIAGRQLSWEVSDQARLGDHRWWISSLDAFKADYPSWDIEYDVDAVLREIYAANVDHWSVAVPQSS